MFFSAFAKTLKWPKIIKMKQTKRGPSNFILFGGGLRSSGRYRFPLEIRLCVSLEKNGPDRAGPFITNWNKATRSWVTWRVHVLSSLHKVGIQLETKQLPSNTEDKWARTHSYQLTINWVGADTRSVRMGPDLFFHFIPCKRRGVGSRMSQQGRHDEWGGKKQRWGRKEKKESSFLFLFSHCWRVCVWVIFDSIQSGRLTHSWLTESQEAIRKKQNNPKSVKTK